MISLVILIIVLFNSNCALQSISEKKCQEFYSSDEGFEKFEEPSKCDYKNAAPEEFPYIVLIGYHKNNESIVYTCDATLIRSKYVVAAGHCVSTHYFPLQVFSIATGKRDDDPNSPAKEVIPVERIIRHPNYDGRQIYYEIALLELARNSTQRPACLWTSSITVGMEANHIVFALDDLDRYEKLTKTQAQVVSTTECSKYYPEDRDMPHGISDDVLFCAAGQNKIYIDFLVSQGPLIIQRMLGSNWIPYLIGMGSIDTDDHRAPVIYTKVPAFIDWIESIVWPDA